MNVIILVFAALVVAGRPLPEMIGDWHGRGDIVVSWTNQRELPVRLTIAPNGAVRGTIGDARFDGRLVRNRGSLGRALHIKTDYLITGRLEGCLVASEIVCRDWAKLPLDWSGSRFIGGLHTNGTIAGGKDRMMLSVARLSLVPGTQ